MQKHLLPLLGAALLSGPALAQNITAGNPAEIVNLARGFGSANLEATSKGDPMITGRMDGTSYRIFFYGCKNKTNCESIQFYAGWSSGNNSFTTQDMNQWNKTKRFGRAYLDDNNDPAVEMDVNMEYGISRRNLEESFSLWKTIMGSFKNTVNK